jgi:predicted peptidase
MESNTPFPTTPSIYQRTLDGQRYTLSIPQGFQPEQPSPLILALHYAGHGEPYYGKAIVTELVEPALRPLDAVIVSPDCPGENWTEHESEAAVFDLLDAVEAAYTIDPGRRLVTGYSMGGIGAWFYAARQAHRFSAAVILSGRPPDNAAAIPWKLPLYVIHSRDDELISFEQTAQAVRALKAEGVEIEFQPLEEITHFETYRFVKPLREAVPWVQDMWW